MPFLISCPYCSTKLKTQTPIQVGRILDCPKCREPFAVPVAKEISEIEPGPISGSFAAASQPKLNLLSSQLVPPPANPKPTPAKTDHFAPPKAAKRNPVEDDYEETKPTSKSKRTRHEDDFEEEKPASRSKRSRYEDDFEEERPSSKSKRSRHEDDFEDRASRKSKADDYDDEPLSSRKWKKKRPKQKVDVVKWLLISGACLSALVVTIFLFSFLSGGSSSSDMYVYLPADTKCIIGVDVANLLAEERVKKIASQLLAKSEMSGKLLEVGLTEKDIDKAVFAMDTDIYNPSPNQPNYIAVVKLRNSLDPAKFQKALNGKESTYEGKTMYSKGDIFVFLPTDKMIVLSNKEDSLKKSVKQTKSVLSDNLQNMVDKIDTKQFWLCASTSSDQMSQQFRNSMNGKQSTPSLEKFVKKIVGIGMGCSLQGDTLKLGMNIQGTDSRAASDAVSEINATLNDPKAGIRSQMKLLAAFGDSKTREITEKIIDSLRFSSSSGMMIISFDLDIKPLEALFNSLGNPMGGGNPFGQANNPFAGFGGGRPNPITPPGRPNQPGFPQPNQPAFPNLNPKPRGLRPPNFNER